ncbi:MAG: type IV pilus secretin PilQ [Sinobacteraceae bacterium]|nr:type IV pilus secretin PilQ [Nevskiaceae bacterium]MCP5470643.1 type IV pilus secretin PilQ [Nevskiaceae bacterium]
MNFAGTSTLLSRAAFALWAVLVTAAGLTTPQARAQDAVNKLEAVDVQTLPGQQIQLTLRLSGPAPEPLAFTIDNPARISLDLPGTALALPSRRIDVRSGGLDTILAAEANGRTRLVMNLDRLLPYQTKVAGNTIVMNIGSALGAGADSAAAPRATVASTRSNSAAPAGVREIRSIDFRRGGEGMGRLIVNLSDPRTPINLRQQGNQIVVDFAGTAVPNRLIRRFDALDFATPVQSFDVVRADDGARIVLSAMGDFEQLAYQSDDQYVVEIQPARKAAAQADEKREYTGERLTLNFQNIETRAVLQLLADASGQNIVVSDSVSGSVTLRLQNVPWDQALDIVLRTKGLDMRRTDNVIIVAPSDELASREKAELAARKDIQELAPLRSEYLQVNYAKAADLAELIKSQGGSLMSARGSVAVDERTNTLLLQDTADRLADIRRLVGTLDIPVRQVLIEARIVIVNDDFTRELGVRAGVTGVRENGNDGVFVTSGSLESTDTSLSSALTNLRGGNGTPYPIEVPTGGAANQRYNVNLPVTSPAGRLAFMVLGSDYIVDLELSAAQAEGRGEIISSPRVITANQKEASIEQGVEIPYQESASSGATTIQFKKAVLALKVTPQITPDNRIILDLNVKKDSVGRIVVASGGINVPSIDTREINTQVLVNDGQTVVLGGILETERRETERKVPYLGDIPGLGILFKTTTKTNDKDELLIFVTPKILREGVNVY